MCMYSECSVPLYQYILHKIYLVANIIHKINSFIPLFASINYST